MINSARSLSESNAIHYEVAGSSAARVLAPHAAQLCTLFAEGSNLRVARGATERYPREMLESHPIKEV